MPTGSRTALPADKTEKETDNYGRVSDPLLFTQGRKLQKRQCCQPRQGKHGDGGRVYCPAVGGDLFEIETVTPYAGDYRTCTEEAKRELSEGARPELKQYLRSLDGYDTVFVCGPCWWGTFPCAVFSQLERLDFTGKKVIAVMTHEGSGLGHSEADLKKICRGASFGRGIAVWEAKAAESEREVSALARQAVK